MDIIQTIINSLTEQEKNDIVEEVVETIYGEIEDLLSDNNVNLTQNDFLEKIKIVTDSFTDQVVSVNILASNIMINNILNIIYTEKITSLEQSLKALKQIFTPAPIHQVQKKHKTKKTKQVDEDVKRAVKNADLLSEMIQHESFANQASIDVEKQRELVMDKRYAATHSKSLSFLNDTKIITTLRDANIYDKMQMSEIHIDWIRSLDFEDYEVGYIAKCMLSKGTWARGKNVPLDYVVINDDLKVVEQKKIKNRPLDLLNWEGVEDILIKRGIDSIDLLLLENCASLLKKGVPEYAVIHAKSKLKKNGFKLEDGELSEPLKRKKGKYIRR